MRPSAENTRPGAASSILNYSMTCLCCYLKDPHSSISKNHGFRNRNYLVSVAESSTADFR